MPVTDSSVDFDWFSPEVCRDPQLYDGLIREAAPPPPPPPPPVVYSPQYGVWATGRHAQIELMMRDWKTFSSTRPAFEEIGQPMILLSDDPPDHQRVRTVISKGMSAAVLRRWQEDFTPRPSGLVRSVLDAPDGVIDGHADLAKKYVLKGVPRRDRARRRQPGDADQVRARAVQHVRAEETTSTGRPWRQRARSSSGSPRTASGTRSRLAASAWRCTRRRTPGRLPRKRPRVLVRTLYSAGSDTTIYALGNTLRALAQNPGQYQLLRSNIDEFATRAFEEGIRYDNPARFTRRRATADVDVDGVTLPAD